MTHSMQHDGLKDHAPFPHKCVRILFFLTSFSWTFNPIQDYMGESTPIEKILTRMVPMLIVAAYTCTHKNRGRLKRLLSPWFLPLLWYIAFGVLGGFSSVQPALSLWKGAEMIIATAFICLSCGDARETQREFTAFIQYYEVILWSSIVLAMINPTLGLHASKTTLPWLQSYIPIINPNGIGFIAVICLTRLLFFPAQYKPLRLAVVSGVLLCAQSRTSYAVTAIVGVIYLYDALRKNNPKRIIPALFGTLAFATLALGMLDTLIQLFQRGQTQEEMSSLSGRTNYWEFALQYTDFTGKGLATGSRSLIFIDNNPFKKGAVNLHNSAVEALLDAGYIGAIPFIALFAVNILRQCGFMIAKPHPFHLLFGICAITFVARSMTSLALALFSFDFNNMLFMWMGLATQNTLPHQKTPKFQRPQPVVYEKTLYEQNAPPHA